MVHHHNLWDNQVLHGEVLMDLFIKIIITIVFGIVLEVLKQQIWIVINYIHMLHIINHYQIGHQNI